MNATCLICTSLVFASIPLCAQDATTSYQKELSSICAKFNQLEIERTDYRKQRPVLEPSKEAERQQLIGQRHLLDPYWRYEQQLEEDINAIAAHLLADDPDRAKALATYKATLAALAGLTPAPTKQQAEAEVAKLRANLAKNELKAGYQ